MAEVIKMMCVTVSVFVCLSTLVCNVQGMTYAVAIPGFELQTEGQLTGTYKAIMINTGTRDITVSIETKATEGSPTNKNVPSDVPKAFTIEPDNVMNGSEIANRTVLFSSADDFVLQVFTESTSTSHSEGLLGIPIESLSGPHQIDNVYEYVVSTFCASSGFCQLAVTSNQPVDVKVTLPGHVNDVVFCIGFRYFRSWRDRLFALDKFDALQIETTKDLTGTHIYSIGVPFVVYVGSRNVTTAGMAKHMLEQLTPASHWGKNFGVTTLGTGNYGDVLKIAATMPETLVKIRGFPDFVINNRSHVVTRRLDKGMSTWIEASNPIQVMQFTGLTYATSDPEGNVAMTTVPAVEHATNLSTVTCGVTPTMGKFFLLTGKTSSTPTVGSNDATDKQPILYWDRAIHSASSTNAKFEIAGNGVSGIVQCDGKAALPLATMNVNNMTVTEEYINTDETCIEGEDILTGYEYGYSPKPAIREINGTEVLKIRVHVCGEAVIKLEQGTNTTLVVRLTALKTSFDLCHGDSCETSEELEPDGYNTQLGCGSDMAIYWIKQTQLNDTSLLFCFGYGPVSDKTSDCTDNTKFTTIFHMTGGNLFERYSVVGLNNDAFFLTDLESSSGCAVHVSDWRCEDKLQNCSKYDDVCDSQNDAFTTAACKKYCGKCKVDSYGKKFLVVFPHLTGPTSISKCYMTVAVKDAGLNVRVSVATRTQVVSADSRSTITTFLYDCSPYIDKTIIIRSNVEVAVSVLYWINDKVLTHNIFPVDAFGKEYVAFTAYTTQQSTYCKLVSENEGVSVVPQFSDLTLKDGADQPLEDGSPFELDTEFTLVMNEGMSEKSVLLFFSDQPIGVFCGTVLRKDRHPDSFNQLLPTDVWGTLYRTPAFGTLTASRPFNGELQIQAYTPNTFVSVDGDFNANYSLISTGQVERVETNLDSSYVIRSNYPVAVGLYVKDATDADAAADNDKVASFHVIPPVASYGTNTLLASPMRVLETLFPEFGPVSSMNSYVINTQGNSSTIALNYSNEAFVRSVVNGEAFGLTVAIGNGSQWFMMPTYSSFVPFSNTNPQCIITTAVPGDGVDNDCDGLTDEDVCYVGYGVYGEDLDLDGDYNDDCLSSMKTEPTIEPKVDDPVCLFINKTVGQCWTVCSCKCSWVKNYEAMQNMTTEEFVALQKERSDAVQNAIKIKKDGLSSETAKLGSAEDERQSAANIGYLGIALFAIVFGTIFIMDISSLLRDMKTFSINFRHGIRRLWKSCRSQTRR